MSRDDAYMVAAKVNDFRDYGGVPASFALMIELNSKKDVAKLHDLQIKHPKDIQLMFCSSKASIISGRATRSGLALIDKFGGTARYEFAQALVPSRISPHTPAIPVPPAISYPSAPAEPPGGNVLRGVIDTGCPFAHKVLRRSTSSTAIRAIWDQNLEPDFGNYGRKPLHAANTYGAVVYRQLLDAAIAASPQHDQASERQCYSHVGYGELQRRTSHGAQVIGQFANSSHPNGDDYLFVQLPRDLLMAPSRAALGKAIFDGLEWILHEALVANEAARGACPKFTELVVNVSYSSSLGPHDGTSIFEKGLVALCEFAQSKGIRLEVVFASGNDYATQLHARVPKLKAGNPAHLRWRVPPANELPSFCEVWGPPGALTVSVQPPTGSPIILNADVSSASNSDKTVTLVRKAQRNARHVLVLVRIGKGGSKNHLVREASGDYLITLTREKTTKNSTHLYLSHVRSTTGYPVRGAQSHFVAHPVLVGSPMLAGMPDAPYFAGGSPTEANSFVDMSGTLNGLGCFKESVLVGGYKMQVIAGASKKWPAVYTAAGPSRDGGKICPDYSTLSEKGPSVPGILCTGNYSAVTVRMNGTSVAAAQYAGHTAHRGAVQRSLCDPRLGDAVEFPSQRLDIEKSVASTS